MNATATRGKKRPSGSTGPYDLCGLFHHVFKQLVQIIHIEAFQRRIKRANDFEGYRRKQKADR